MITPLTIMIVGFLGAVTFKLINYSATGKKNIDSPINFDIKNSRSGGRNEPHVKKTSFQRKMCGRVRHT